MKFLKRLILLFFFLVFLGMGALYVVVSYHKDDISALLISTLKEKYGLSIDVRTVRVSFLSNWPHASVVLKDVSVSSDRYGINGPRLRAGSLSLSFNLRRLMNKEFVVRRLLVRDGEIILIKDSLNSFSIATDTPVTIANDDPASYFRFALKKLTLRNTKLVYINEVRPQHAELNFVNVTLRFKDYADAVAAEFKGKIYLKGLMFHPARGEFFRHCRAIAGLDLTWLKESKVLFIHQGSQVVVDRQLYNLAGILETGIGGKLSLIAEGKDLKLEKVSRLLNSRIQKVISRFYIQKSLDAKVLIVAGIGCGEEPLIIADIQGRDSDLSIGNGDLEYADMTFSGRIISMDSSRTKGDPSMARVIFPSIRGKVSGMPFTASVRVINFRDPHMTLRGNVRADVSKFSKNAAACAGMKGTVYARFSCSGPAKKMNRTEFDGKGMKFRATLDLRDVSCAGDMIAGGLTFNGKAAIVKGALKFRNLNMRSGITNASLSGTVDRFVDILKGEETNINAQLVVRTKMLDLNPVFHLPDTGSAVSDIVRSTQVNLVSHNVAESRFTHQVALTLHADQMISGKFAASDVKVRMNCLDDFTDIRELSLYSCGGRIKASGTLRRTGISADIYASNLDVKQLFMEFDNFGQNAIGYQNLMGKITIEANFVAVLGDKYRVLTESLRCDGNVKLNEGRLLNFEPVQKLSNFLFRNRDFNDVAFSEVSQRFSIRGKEMRIHELEVASTLLNLYVVDGIYNFGGESNINLTIPWSNLKKRDRSFIPRRSGERSEQAKGVRLNYSGPSTGMKLSFGHRAINSQS